MISAGEEKRAKEEKASRGRRCGICDFSCKAQFLFILEEKHKNASVIFQENSYFSILPYLKQSSAGRKKHLKLVIARKHRGLRVGDHSSNQYQFFNLLCRRLQYPEVKLGAILINFS